MRAKLGIASLGGARRSARVGVLALGLVVAALATSGTPRSVAQPAAAAPAAKAALVGDPDRVGTNLGPVAAWEPGWMFVDAFRHATPWRSQTAPSVGDASLDDAPLDLDARGWVRSLAPGQEAETIVWTNEGSRAAGRYVVRYSGVGTLEPLGGPTVVAESPGRLVLDVAPGECLVLRLTATDATDPVRDVRVLSEDLEDTTETFHPALLARLAPFDVVRLTGVQRTGELASLDGGRSWAARPRPDDAFQSSDEGPALEHLVALANRAHAHPWLGIPHDADDDYVRSFATLVRDALDPSLSVFVEYGSELLMGGAAYDWVSARGLALGLADGADPFLAALRHQVRRSVEIFGIFEEIFGGDERLVRVLGGIACNPWVTGELLRTTVDGDPAAARVDAVAVGARIGETLWDRPDVSSLSLAGLLNALAEDSARVHADAAMHAAEATAAGVALLALAAGPHLVDHREPSAETEALRTLFETASRHPQMEAITREHLAGWRLAGGGIVAAPALVGRFDGGGALLEDLESPPLASPRYRAFTVPPEEPPLASAPAPAPSAAPGDPPGPPADPSSPAALLDSPGEGGAESPMQGDPPPCEHEAEGCPIGAGIGIGPPAAVVRDGFGRSVALDDRTALVGAGNAVSVLVRDRGDWRQAQTLAAPADAIDFGFSVALDGDTALVGDPRAERVHVYVRADGRWHQDATLTSGFFDRPGSFGWSVALEGDVALVGSPNERFGSELDHGHVYVFRREPSGDWMRRHRLSGPDTAGGPRTSIATFGDHFGFSVALEDGLGVVGAPYAGDYGAVYLLGRDALTGAGWGVGAKITPPPGPGAPGAFGVAVSTAEGGRVAVGASGYAAEDPGAAFVFAHDSGSWIPEYRVDGRPGDGLGRAVSLTGRGPLVGRGLLVGAARGRRAELHRWRRDLWTRLWNDARPGRPGFGGAVALGGGFGAVGLLYAEAGDGEVVFYSGMEPTADRPPISAKLWLGYECVDDHYRTHRIVGAVTGCNLDVPPAPPEATERYLSAGCITYAWGPVDCRERVVFGPGPAWPFRRTPQEGPCGDTEPDAGHPNLSGDVLLHNGEERFERSDLAVPGRGDVDFAFVRTYRSQLRYLGPLGHGWTHSYDVRLRERADGSVDIHDGGGRLLRFLPGSDGRYRVETGTLGTLRRAADGWTLRQSGGVRQRFDAAGRLASIIDRHGNRMRFAYDALDNLVRIEDARGRVHRLHYERPQNRPEISLLVALEDEAGRQVRYHYDDHANLVAVRSPRLSGTSTGNDFLDGRLERYGYLEFQRDTDLNHNLVAFSSPEDVARGRGPTVTWAYGVNPADGATFDKVIRQTRGGRTEEIRYLDAGRVEVVDAEGVVTLYHMDAHGHRARKEVRPAGAAPGDPRARVTTYAHLACGLLSERVLPGGMRERRSYEGDCAAGVVPRMVERRLESDARGADGAGAPLAELVERWSYEPLYGALASYTSPSGATTRAYFDYQEHDAPVAEALALGISLAPMARGLGDLNGDGRTGASVGDVVRVVAAEGTPLEQVSRYVHDARGELVRSVGADGVVTELTLDAASGGAERASLTVDPSGLALRTSLERDALGRVVRVTDARGATTSLEHNALDELVSVTRDALRSESVYDADGRVIRSREGSSPSDRVTTSYAYDATGDLVEVTDESDPARPATTRIEHTPAGRIRRLSSPAGRRASYAYDAFGLPSAVVAGDGAELAHRTELRHDASGRLEAISEAAGTLRAVRDGFGRVAAMVDAAGGETRLERDAEGRPTRVRVLGQPSGVSESVHTLLAEERRSYDALGRLARIERAAFVPGREGEGAARWLTTRLGYDGASRLVEVDEDGRRTRFGYDGAGRLVEATDPAGNAVRLELDAGGNAVRVHRISVDSAGLMPPRPSTSERAYDALGRLVRATDPSGVSIALAYDGLGYLASVTRPDGLAVRYEHDRAGRLVAERRELGAGDAVDLGFEYDADGLLAAWIDDRGARTSFAHDAVGRLVSETRPGGATTRYAYDAAGRLSRLSRPDGTVVDHRYDALSRLVAVDAARGSVREAYGYAWDGLSRLVRATASRAGSEPSVVERVVDSLGRAIEERQDGARIGYAYAADGGLERVELPSGRALLFFDRDALGRPHAIAEPGGEPFARYRSIGGRIVGRRHDNGTAHELFGADGTAGLDLSGRVAVERASGPGGVLFERRYGYDAGGSPSLVEHRDGAGGVDRFEHDAEGRLRAARYGLPDVSVEAGALVEERFRHDGAGNRLEHVRARPPAAELATAYVTNDLGELASVTRSGEPVVLGYDAAGNLVDNPLRGHRYEYDLADRLIAVRDRASGALVARYDHDALGRRVRKRTYDAGGAPVEERYLYDGARIAEERDGAGRTRASYVWGLGGIDELIALEATEHHGALAPGRYHAHQDARGDVVALTDAAGALVERARYAAFGDVLEPADGGPPRRIRYGFQGRELDHESGLYHFRARAYDPDLGRFLQRDPVWDPVAAGHPYAFVGNGPLARTDPSGLKSRVGDFVRSYFDTALRQIAQSSPLGAPAMVIRGGLQGAGVLSTPRDYGFWLDATGYGSIGRGLDNYDLARQLGTSPRGGLAATNAALDFSEGVSLIGGLAFGISSLARTGLAGLSRGGFARSELTLRRWVGILGRSPASNPHKWPVNHGTHCVPWAVERAAGLQLSNAERALLSEALGHGPGGTAWIPERVVATLRALGTRATTTSGFFDDAFGYLEHGARGVMIHYRRGTVRHTGYFQLRDGGVSLHHALARGPNRVDAMAEVEAYYYMLWRGIEGGFIVIP
jgi:RHS repeat-associated protein